MLKILLKETDKLSARLAKRSTFRKIASKETHPTDSIKRIFRNEENLCAMLKITRYRTHYT